MADDIMAEAHLRREIKWQERKPEQFRGQAHSFHNNLLSQELTEVSQK
jgi:hypothetical protein